MSKRITIPVKIGTFVLTAIEQANDGRKCHMVMMVFPLEANSTLGQPAFLSSLEPDVMEDVVVQVAGNFALIDKSTRIIDGIDEQ
jgi:hypothetical protein